jgi:hypothetical protein
MSQAISLGFHELIGIIGGIFRGSLSTGQFSIITVWLGAACTLGIYSLLYKENPVYRIFEYLFLGVGAAYGFLRLYQDNLMVYWYGPLKEGQWWWMIPFLFGCLYFTIYIDKLSWMARTLIGTLMGIVAGFTLTQTVVITYFPQITDSFKPLLPGSVRAYHVMAGKPMIDTAGYEAGNNIVYFVTLVAVMTYFFFSFEHRNKVVTGTAKLGRYLLMLSFGTMFGATITARVALAVSRMLYLLHDWLRLIKI